MKDDPRKYLKEIDQILQSDLSNDEAVLRVAQVMMEYKKEREERLKDLTPTSVKRITPLPHQD